MTDFFVFWLLFFAVGIGWFLGRRSLHAPSLRSELPSQYYRGLNFLLDGRPDVAVDAFINALEVNSDTLETHIALGNLLRKRGEVDRAIRIHQNLLARPSLSQEHIHLAHLELARDYVSAGLLDRAERLLLDLVEEAPEQRLVARRHLLDVYQSERDWSQAIKIAIELLPKKKILKTSPNLKERGQAVAIVLAHYYCELAFQKKSSGELSLSRELLNKAIFHDRYCVRALIQLGEIELMSGRPIEAIKSLKKIREFAPEFISETIFLLRDAFAKAGQTDTITNYLRECYKSHPNPTIALEIAEDLLLEEGSESAREFLYKELREHPSLGGLSKLIKLQPANLKGNIGRNLDQLLNLVDILIKQRTKYRCDHCGFSGHQLHWYCPGCKYWGTVRPLHSEEIEKIT